MSAEKVLQGRCIVEGCVEGEALVTNDAISFMGTINSKTGYVIERKHEIEGACLKGKILVFPMSKGSTGGSYMLYDLVKNGVGPLGIVNREAGCVDYSCNLDFYGQDLREFLTNALQKPIYMDNDANCAAYGEFVAGGAKGVSDAVAITLGTGIGGGIIIDKKIYSGFNFAGAEIGHTVIQMGGRPCTCGRRGCFEAYASATGLIRSTREAMEAHPESEMWALCGGDSAKADGHTAFDGMRAGDEAAAEVVRDYIEALACGVTDIINTFAPEILCIGGGISKEGDTLIAPLSEIVHREMYSRFSKRQTRIVTAELGNDAGIIGAAALGLQYC